MAIKQYCIVGGGTASDSTESEAVHRALQTAVAACQISDDVSNR